VARHRTPAEKQELGERAREMRAAGRSRREIQAELGIGDDLAKGLLRGVPLPDSLARPRAKDDLREVAVRMRLAGRTYDDIAADLGISKSTCSLWLRHLALPVPGSERESALPAARAAAGEAAEVEALVDPRRDEARELRCEGLLLREIGQRLGVSSKTAYYWTWGLPLPPRARSGGDPAHMDMMRRRYWDPVLAEREADRAVVKAAAAGRVRTVSSRELELLAVIAYWCEGSKDKPYARREQVTFINSDAGLIRLFLAYLDDIGFPAADRRFSLSIHESADVQAATTWWSDVVGIPEDGFGPASLKRHNAKTVRKNVGVAYVGCLVVRLVQCRMLYQRIEGVWQGIMAGLALPAGKSAVR
jgi:transposase